jgi:hypothetical protein
MMEPLHETVSDPGKQGSSAADWRRGFLALAWRRHQPARLGSRLSLLAARTTHVRWPDLRDALLGLPWAVCGAVATRLYMPERATADLDVLIHSVDRESVHARLEDRGFVRQGDLSIGASTWRSPADVGVDVRERDDPWVREALAGAAQNRDAQGLPILPLPFLALMKLQASRGQDLADLLRMLGPADDATLNDVRRVIQAHAHQDSQDLESLIELGRLEQPSEGG